MSTKEGPGQLFGLGITLGIVFGFVLGSLVTLRLGDDLVDVTSHLIDRFASRDDRVNFELLLQ
jgi:hypothetical protein